MNDHLGSMEREKKKLKGEMILAQMHHVSEEWCALPHNHQAKAISRVQ